GQQGAGVRGVRRVEERHPPRRAAAGWYTRLLNARVGVPQPDVRAADGPVRDEHPAVRGTAEVEPGPPDAGQRRFEPARERVPVSAVERVPDAYLLAGRRRDERPTVRAGV